jgi:putative flavoprotein involved in K+ transport
VLVVGVANSGAQIAEDLAATHRVHLSQGARIPRMPRRLLGKSVHFYGDHLGLIAAPLDSWRGRTQRGDLLIGTSLRQLQRRHGVDLRGRTAGARECTVSFEDGTELNVETVIWATGFRSDYSWIHAAAGPPGPCAARPAGRRPAGTSLPWSSGWPVRTPNGGTAGSTANWPAWE